MVKPITPDEVLRAKQSSIPEVVFEVVNALLSERYTGYGSARLMQKEILAEVLARMRADGALVTKNEVFQRHWLDFEQVYRDAGWRVDYDSPAFNESYEPSWSFSKKR